MGTSIVICVSPLTALMMEQRAKFTGRGIATEFVGELQQDVDAMEGVKKGKTQLLFISPESLLRNPQWREMLLCAGNWGTPRIETRKEYCIRHVLQLHRQPTSSDLLSFPPVVHDRPCKKSPFTTRLVTCTVDIIHYICCMHVFTTRKPYDAFHLLT